MVVYGSVGAGAQLCRPTTRHVNFPNQPLLKHDCTLGRYDAGAKDYWMSDSSLTAIEFLVIGNLELKRYEGWKEHKTVRALTRTLITTVIAISFSILTKHSPVTL